MRNFQLFLATSLAIQAIAFSNSSQEVGIKWLGDRPAYYSGTTFGLPWARGRFFLNDTKFALATGEQIQSWPTAYWTDGSLKWTGHAIPRLNTALSDYTVIASIGGHPDVQSNGIILESSNEYVIVNTGNITVSFPKNGSFVIDSIATANGKIVGEKGILVLGTKSAIGDLTDDSAQSLIKYSSFESNIEEVVVTQNTSARILVSVRGTHVTRKGTNHTDWLPFILRFYLYSNSDAIRIIHTLIFDGNATENFITGVGIRFKVPLEPEELYDRHIRLAGSDGGFLHESVQGITGLRTDPGQNVRTAQFSGDKTPNISTWGNSTTTKLKYNPTWNDYSLTQLSPDGFTLKKRTKAGQGWVKIPGATRSGGLAYLGGAARGGLAIGLRNFWQRYPTGLDIRDAATETGEITCWIYSPAAEPLDLRPYRDNTALEDYASQLEGLTIAYEDWEPGFDSPYGISISNEIFIYAFDKTPSGAQLANLVDHTNKPPVLIPDSQYMHETKAIGTYWAPLTKNTSEAASAIENHLDFLVKFYETEIEQRRWYGFLDYGDIMHTYDSDRHTWRYDIGGYAWDNSELSPNLFFWSYFLQTGREDVYRLAEAHARHTSEVDVYHRGAYKSLGTRHGVAHWSDSAKQARISTAQYRKVFYFITGGDERIGELLDETLDTDVTYSTLDPNRKVRTDGWTPSKNSTATISLGTDWSALAASWLLEWERHGPRWAEAQEKLTNTLLGIGELRNGFVTGSALYNATSGELTPPPTDLNNTGVVAVSHLSAVFGLMEVIAELTEHYGSDLPRKFEEAWLDYCIYYSSSPATQLARYNSTWTLNLRQGQSRLLAYASSRLSYLQSVSVSLSSFLANASLPVDLAQRAWSEFHSTGDDGFNSTLGFSDKTTTWETTKISGSDVLIGAGLEEATWLSSNNMANYGLAAIVNLAYVGEWVW